MHLAFVRRTRHADMSAKGGTDHRTYTIANHWNNPTLDQPNLNPNWWNYHYCHRDLLQIHNLEPLANPEQTSKTHKLHRLAQNKSNPWAPQQIKPIMTHTQPTLISTT